MSTNIWQGGAPSRAQVYKGTITSTTGTQTYIATITDDQGSTHAYTYVITGSEGSVTAVGDAFCAGFNASSNPYLQRVTATNAAGVISFTADTAGEPFSIALTGTGSWGSTGETVSSSGPNDLAVLGNWSLNLLPVANDHVVIPAGAPSILYGLGALSAVNIGGFHRDDGFAGQIGRIVGTRLHSLRLNAPDVLRIRGSGSLCAIDIGSAAIPVVIDDTGTPSQPGRPVVNIIGSAITDITHIRGFAAVAGFPGQTSAVTGTIRVLAGTFHVGSPTSSVNTIATGSDSKLTQSGGTVRMYSRVNNVETSGTSNLYDHSGATIATVKVIAPAVFWHVEAGTYTDIEIGGTTDCTQGVGAVTYTAAKGYPGGRVRDITGRLPAGTAFVLRDGAFAGNPDSGGFEVTRPPSGTVTITA